MAKELEKKIFGEQTLVFTLSQQPQLQGLFMADTPEGQEDYNKTFSDNRGVLYPRRLANNNIIKLSIPGEESLLSRNTMSDMHLFYLKNVVYSALVPDIKIYKVETTKDKDGTVKRKKVVELEFPRAMTNQLLGQDNARADIDLSRPLLQRRGQIGITSFDWEYVGKDTYTANRDIRATLTMTMDSMGALTEVRKNKDGQEYRLLDILTPSKSFRQEQKAQVESSKMPKYDAGAYEILVEAGYMVDEEKLNAMLAAGNVGAKTALIFTDETDKQIKDTAKQISFRKMKSCMYLTVENHQFNFGENGKVDCTVNFIARKDGQDKQPETNILPDAFAKKVIADYEDRIKKIDVKLEEQGAPDSLKKKKEEYQEELKKARQKASESFMRKVLEILEAPIELASTAYRTRIFDVNLTSEQADLFGSYVADPSVEKLSAFLSSASSVVGPRPEDAKPEVFQFSARRAHNSLQGVDNRAGTTVSPDGDKITGAQFVFFGDLLDAVITHAGPKYFEDNRYVLGNIEMPDIENPYNSRTRYMPIAGIPISMALLRATMEESIVKNKKQKMTMTQFIQLFANTVLKEALGRQTAKLFKNPEKKIGVGSFTHYVNPRNPDPTETADEFLDVVSLNPSVAKSTAKKVRAEGFSGRSLTGPVKHYSPGNMRVPVVLSRISSACSEAAYLQAQSQKMLNISVIHEQGNNELYKGVGDLEADFKRQIPHFTHGQPYGLIKRVKLSKDDLPYLAEMRTETSDDNSTDNYLTNVYSATFEMIGNDLNTLGGLIFLDPYGLDPFGSLGDPNDRDSLSFIMGLGGLYLITKIKHSMTPGKYTTTVTTRFENRGEIKRASKK